MTQKITTVAVLGLGKVGSLVAQLLAEAGFDVTGFDHHPHQSEHFRTETLDVTNGEALKGVLSDADAVLSCLPYSFNKDVATAAAAAGTHYFDLTEDVATTNHIRDLAKGAGCVFAPQCGLAPGFIGIVGAHLASRVENLRSIKLRVGALPQNPTGIMGYNFNWSPEGVVNEYLNDCEVIQNGERKTVSPLDWLEDIYINGQKLEAFTTSGGLGTMCETFHGRVEHLDYKSMRYPGHARVMNFFFHELLMEEDRKLAGKILTHAKPPVNDDMVFIHASAEGWQNGDLVREEFVRAYRPQIIDGQFWRAISWTTAASVAAVVEMVSAGTLPQKGFIKQEEIPLKDFLKTKSGHLYIAGDKQTGMRRLQLEADELEKSDNEA